MCWVVRPLMDKTDLVKGHLNYQLFFEILVRSFLRAYCKRGLDYFPQGIQCTIRVTVFALELNSSRYRFIEFKECVSNHIFLFCKSAKTVHCLAFLLFGGLVIVCVMLPPIATGELSPVTISRGGAETAEALKPNISFGDVLRRSQIVIRPSRSGSRLHISYFARVGCAIPRSLAKAI